MTCWQQQLGMTDFLGVCEPLDNFPTCVSYRLRIAERRENGNSFDTLTSRFLFFGNTVFSMLLTTTVPSAVDNDDSS